jgi:hypothetical protein
MNRFRLAAPALVLGLGLLSGCCNVGHGEILNRLGFGPRCPCETCSSGPIGYEGPDLGDGGCCAGGAGGGPMILGPSGVPPLASPPLNGGQQAQQFPAGPTSLSKSR